MLILLVLGLFCLPEPARASCESCISVRSSVVVFCSDDVWPHGDMERAAHRRALAHALATAQACFDSARVMREGPGAVRLVLTSSSGLRPADFRDRASRRLAARCARADWDSACVVWTCELGRFRTEPLARDRTRSVRAFYVPDCGAPGDLRGVEARVLYSSCFGSWAPASYVVPVRGEWAARAGFFFTRKDAEGMARTWSRVTGHGVNVVRQRVDGPLLEQVLAQPDDPS